MHTEYAEISAAGIFMVFFPKRQTLTATETQEMAQVGQKSRELKQNLVTYCICEYQLELSIYGTIEKLSFFAFL